MSEEKDFDDAVNAGLDDYEQYYTDWDLETSLNQLGILVIIRERVSRIIQMIKNDVRDSYIEKPEV
jgi:hypothetical protein